VPHFKKKVFAEWPLKNGKWMRVHIEYFAGHDLIHVRRWRRAPDGQFFATAEGATIEPNRVTRLIKALRKVRAHARKIGVLPEKAAPSGSRNRPRRKIWQI
jgi:hypothetical protein